MACVDCVDTLDNFLPRRIVQPFVLISFIVATSHALLWPRIFKNEMVLQANPTKAVLWGYIDHGNAKIVNLNVECILKNQIIERYNKNFTPKKVHY